MLPSDEPSHFVLRELIPETIRIIDLEGSQ